MWYIKSRMVLLASLRLLLVAVLCLPAFTSLHADSLGIINDKELVVQYDEPLKNAAREVIVLYPRIKHDLEGILGWKIDFNPSIWLIREHTRFQEMTVNPYVIAFAVPSKNLIVIDYSKMNISPFTLEVTLKHEMCHLILGNNIPDVRLPRWLNEGFCQWFTGGIAELMIDDKQPNLQKASLAHRLIPLTSLNMHFPGDKNQLILAYEESKSVVDYIVTGSGPGGVVSILGHLREGDAIDEAASKSLSLTLDELEKHWIQYLQGNVTWIGYLAANIYMILLFVAALITVFGFIRIIIKRRLRASRIEEDDEEVGLN